MAAESKRFGFPFDKARVGVECGDCRTHLTIGYAKFEPAHWISVEAKCVICNTLYPDEVKMS